MKCSKDGMAVVAFSWVVAGAIACFAAPPQSLAQATTSIEASGPQTLATSLIGTWKLEEASTPGSPSGIGSRLKLFTGTYWCVVQPDTNSGQIVFQHGGSYQVDGDQVKTKTEFAGASTKGMIGTNGTLTIKVDGDTMTQTDPKGVFNETWKRVK